MIIEQTTKENGIQVGGIVFTNPWGGATSVAWRYDPSNSKAAHSVGVYRHRIDRARLYVAINAIGCISDKYSRGLLKQRSIINEFCAVRYTSVTHTSSY